MAHLGRCKRRVGRLLLTDSLVLCHLLMLLLPLFLEVKSRDFFFQIKSTKI